MLKQNLSFFDLNHYDENWITNSPITIEMMQHYQILPLNQNEQYLSLAMVDPSNEICLAAVRFHTGLRVKPFLVSETLLKHIIHRHANHDNLNNQLASTISQVHPIETSTAITIENEENDEPIIALVSQLIQDAIQKKASDIHIEPYAHHYRVRFRQDGLLHEIVNLPLHIATRVITRLKIMADLDIAERRLPQDGRIPFLSECKIDIRLNSCPGLYGEKIAMRLLNSKDTNLHLKSLGLLPNQYQLLLHALSQSQGLILVTGPTGSGKSRTLYSALTHLNTIHKNIVSIEDPIEMELNGIHQVNVNTKIGLDFPTALRSFLRQDPDIIMVGEIRDRVTATVALQAAQTGHLVLSTMHTNNTIATMERLNAMELNHDNLIHSISLIIAQRLIRKLCIHCKQPDISSSKVQYRAIGCDACHQGYAGRIGIFECLPISENIANLFSLRIQPSLFLDEIKKMQLLTLWEAGCEMVNTGITTMSELQRVLGHRL